MLFKPFKKKITIPVSHKKMASQKAPLNEYFGIPVKEYDLLVRPLLAVLASVLSEDNLERVLVKMKRALLLREGYILPVNATPESIIKMHSAYTYALFVAMAVDAAANVYCSKIPNAETAVSPGYAILVASQITPPEGLTWINQYSEVAMVWCDYFVRPESSVLFEISHHSNPKSGSKVSIDAKQTEKVKLESMTVPGETMPKEQGDKPLQSSSPSKNSSRETLVKERAPRTPKGWKVVSSIVEAIEAGTLTVNEPDSLIFRTEEGNAFLVTPEIFDWYEKETGVAAKTARNQFGRLGVHERRNEKDYYKAQIEGVDYKINGMLVVDGSHFFQTSQSKGIKIKIGS